MVQKFYLKLLKFSYSLFFETYFVYKIKFEVLTKTTLQVIKLYTCFNFILVSTNKLKKKVCKS